MRQIYNKVGNALREIDASAEVCMGIAIARIENSYPELVERADSALFEAGQKTGERITIR